MEASALPRSAVLPRPRLAIPAPLLRLRSDEQLIALFRAGDDDAFRAIHDRYRVRLMAYARQMLGGSTADAEDALQEVFVRAHAALLASAAPISLRAWLYRIAHNRCIDQLRRPTPIPSEIMPGAQPALSPGPRHDPPAAAERSEDLQRLVADVDALPEQQRSALLMRELQGLSYEELAVALGISVAAVKSVLLRARGGVLDAAEARAAPCTDIRLELVSAHDRGVRASGRARRHMRECPGCCAYRGELRVVSRQIAALAPGGPLGHLGLMLGLGGGGGAGAGGGLAAGGSTVALGGAASATATKVAALVCCAALVGGAGALRPPAARPAPHAARHAHPARARSASVAAPSIDPHAEARTAGAAIAPAPPRPARAARSADAGPAPSAPPPLTGQDNYAASPSTAAAGTAASAPTLGLAAATGTPSGAPATGARADPGAAMTPGNASPAGASIPPPAADPTSPTPPAGGGTSPAPGAGGSAAIPAGGAGAPPTAAAATPAALARATSFHIVEPRRLLRRREGFSHPPRDLVLPRADRTSPAAASGPGASASGQS